MRFKNPEQVWNNATRYEREALITVLHYYGKKDKQWKKWVSALQNLKFADLNKRDKKFVTSIVKTRTKLMELVLKK